MMPTADHLNAQCIVKCKKIWKIRQSISIKNNEIVNNESKIDFFGGHLFSFFDICGKCNSHKLLSMREFYDAPICLSITVNIFYRIQITLKWETKLKQIERKV